MLLGEIFKEVRKAGEEEVSRLNMIPRELLNVKYTSEVALPRGKESGLFIPTSISHS